MTALAQIYRDFVVEIEGIVRRFVRVGRATPSRVASDEVSDLVQEIFMRAVSAGARPDLETDRRLWTAAT